MKKHKRNPKAVKLYLFMLSELDLYHPTPVPGDYFDGYCKAHEIPQSVINRTVRIMLEIGVLSFDSSTEALSLGPEAIKEFKKRDLELGIEKVERDRREEIEKRTHFPKA